MNEIRVNAGVEGMGNLPRGAGKLDEISAGRDGIDPEAAALQPRLYCLEICFRDAKGSAELRRRQPFVVVGRVRVLETAHELLEGAFLRGAALKQQREPAGREARGNGALVVARLRHGVGVAL